MNNYVNIIENTNLIINFKDTLSPKLNLLQFQVSAEVSSFQSESVY